MTSPRRRTLPTPDAPVESSAQRERLGFRLRRLYQRNQALWSAMALDTQVTSVQTAALGILFDEGPMSLTDLGAAASMDPATTRGVVDRLVAQRLISIRKDPVDRRRVIVHLEPGGEKYIKAMIPVMRDIMDETLSPLNPAERLAFEFLMRKLVPSED